MIVIKQRTGAVGCTWSCTRSRRQRCSGCPCFWPSTCCRSRSGSKTSIMARGDHVNKPARIHTYSRTHEVFTHARTHASIHAYSHAHARMYSHIHTHARMYSCTHTRIRACSRTQIFTRFHARTCARHTHHPTPTNTRYNPHHVHIGVASKHGSLVIHKLVEQSAAPSVGLGLRLGRGLG